jgi:hypothetical protein
MAAPDVEDVARAQLVDVTDVAVHGQAGAPLALYAVGAEPDRLQQTEGRVLEALEVVGDVRWPTWSTSHGKTIPR